MESTFIYASLAMLTVWAFVLLLSEGTRREQLIMSVVGAIVAPGALLMAATGPGAADTLAPGRVGLPYLLFSFSLFGIAAVAYQALLSKRLTKFRGKRYHLASKRMHFFALLLITAGVWLFSATALNLVLGIPALQSLILGGLFIGIYVIADRKDLLFDALVSGIATAVLVLIVRQFFFVRLFPAAGGGVHAEEILWAAVVGFAVGPLYEYLRDLRFR